MQTLSQARAMSGELGDPIPWLITDLTESGAQIRKGQVTMVAAAPGLGKSALVQAILHHGGGKDAKSRVLYFSADSGPEVMYERAVALASGSRLSIDTVREMIKAGNTAELDAYVKVNHSHIRYDFTSSPSQEHVVQELEAYLELYGDYPDVIVMDNLKDLADDQDADEFRALEDAVMFLKDLARETASAVLALHHIVGHLEDGEQPVPLNGVRGKVSKTPALILTLYKPEEGVLRISPVKNRNGKAEASGRYWVPIKIDLGRMKFTT